MGNNQGQWAVVTGASSGIGRAFAEEFAKDNINIYLAARDKKALLSVAKSLEEKYSVKAQVFAGDLSKQRTVKDMLRDMKSNKIDPTYLINNAGFGDYGEFTETKLDKELNMIDLNISSLTHLSKELSRSMKVAGSGYIVNVASTAAFQPGPYMAVYYATKAYVLHFSEAVNAELEGTGVSVTVLCPGPTKTNFAKAADATKNQVFKGGLPGPEDVAKYGYQAMMKRKPVVIHGFRNKVGAYFARVMPRKFVVNTVKRIQARSR